MEPDDPNAETAADAAAAGPPAPKRRRGAIAAGFAFLLIAGVSIKHLHDQQSPDPYAPSAIAAKVTYQVLPGAQAAERALQLAGHAVGVVSSPAVLVGQLTFKTPGNAPHIGQYSLFVIDNAARRPVSTLIGTGPAGAVVRRGWDSRYNKVVAKYGHASGSPAALSFAPDTPSPITFETASGDITDPARQLTFVLAFFSSDGRLYWETTLSA